MLPGAIGGIVYYLKPEMDRLSDTQVKAAFQGLFETEAFVQAYCTLTPRNFLPSPLEALCVC
jgi:hypothetical protein